MKLEVKCSKCGLVKLAYAHTKVCVDCYYIRSKKYRDQKIASKICRYCTRRVRGSYTVCTVCRPKHAQASLEWSRANPVARSALGKKSHRKAKTDVIARYGGKCACCGESRIEFMSVDHINGGGSKHRKEIPSNLYTWLRQQGYPDGFRVLCLNCNLSIGFFGYCPHQREV